VLGQRGKTGTEMSNNKGENIFAVKGGGRRMSYVRNIATPHVSDIDKMD
jgi:hypothetical protein